jgi:hypothetical protein
VEAGRRREPKLAYFRVLALTIGLPYFLLSTTSPLLQAWFARRFDHAIPYRLFALSNLASLLALLAYPVMIEPWVSTVTQSSTVQILVTSNRKLLETGKIRDAGRTLAADPGFRIWTDNFNNLLRVLK